MCLQLRDTRRVVLRIRKAVGSENYKSITLLRNSIDLSEDMFAGVLSVNSSLILLPLS